MAANLLADSLADESAHENAGTNRWMVSYADFMTLLLVFFVALYALNNRPRAAPPPLRPAATTVTSKASPAFDAAQQAAQQDREQQDRAQQLQTQLQPLLDGGQLHLVRDGRGLVLEIPEDALFASGEAVPSARADQVLQSVAAALGRSDGPVRVEGHTDNRPIRSALYPSNWELSAARAAAVVRALEVRGIASQRLSALGLADTRPKAGNDTAQGRALNRRVNLVLLDSCC